MTPIPTILFCTRPGCNEQHIDKDEWATKPHRTHKCAKCGWLWQPYPVDTVGIKGTMLTDGPAVPLWSWPLETDQHVPAGQQEGAFGAVRKHDIHTGVDLYAPHGAPVYAVEDGVVVNTVHFTGVKADSPWWNDTMALLVEGASGVVVYGEISFDTATGMWADGATVRRGDQLGRVAQVLKKDKGKPMSMLHMEIYAHGTRDVLWWKHSDQMKPINLYDPTERLQRALGPEYRQHLRQANEIHKPSYIKGVSDAAEWLGRQAEHYPTDIFSEPAQGEHGKTVDACSAKALRVGAKMWSQGLLQMAKEDE